MHHCMESATVIVFLNIAIEQLVIIACLDIMRINGDKIDIAIGIFFVIYPLDLIFMQGSQPCRPDWVSFIVHALFIADFINAFHKHEKFPFKWNNSFIHNFQG